jgi:hypothetical protein
VLERRSWSEGGCPRREYKHSEIGINVKSAYSEIRKVFNWCCVIVLIFKFIMQLWAISNGNINIFYFYQNVLFTAAPWSDSVVTHSPGDRNCRKAGIQDDDRSLWKKRINNHTLLNIVAFQFFGYFFDRPELWRFAEDWKLQIRTLTRRNNPNATTNRNYKKWRIDKRGKIKISKNMAAKKATLTNFQWKKWWHKSNTN